MSWRLPPEAPSAEACEENNRPERGREAAILAQARAEPVVAHTRSPPPDLVDVDGPVDVLERFLAETAQPQAELAEDGFAHRLRYCTRPARLKARVAPPHWRRRRTFAFHHG